VRVELFLCYRKSNTAASLKIRLTRIPWKVLGIKTLGKDTQKGSEHLASVNRLELQLHPNPFALLSSSVISFPIPHPYPKILRLNKPIIPYRPIMPRIREVDIKAKYQFRNELLQLHQRYILAKTRPWTFAKLFPEH